MKLVGKEAFTNITRLAVNTILGRDSQASSIRLNIAAIIIA